MSVRRILILMVAIISIFIANTGVGVAAHSMLINSNNTTASYTNLDIAYEKSVSYFEPSSTSLIYSTFASVPPTIDGSLSYGEWGEPAIIDTLSYTNDSINYETHDMYVYFMNDNNYLYIAAQIINDDFETVESYLEGKDMDSFTIYFDGNNDEIFESNEDIKEFSNLEYSDWYYRGNHSSRSDTTSDGEGAASHSNHALGDYTYEFKIPLNSGDVHDFAITPDSTIGLKIVYSESYYDSSEGYWISDGRSDSWPNDGSLFDATNYGKLKLSSSSLSDTTPPSITIISPADGITVTTPTITVSGTATDDTGVTILMVNGNPVTLETDGSFTTTVSLTSGVNTITVVATDAAGNSVTETVTVTASLPNLLFAITPTSRLAQVATPVTIFLSVINSGTGNATDVSISQASGLAATIGYQAWNGATLTGTPDTPVDIGAGEAAHFVLTINPTSEFSSSPMTFDVSSTNGATAPVNGVNTLTMAASSTPYADIIMMSTSLDMSTSVNTATAFAMSTTNVGTASATDVSLVVEMPTSITGLSYQVNETNIDGSIKGPATGLTIPVGGSPTFAVFLTPTQAIDYDPANNRIVLKLVDGSGKVVGAQSVAVSTT